MKYKAEVVINREVIRNFYFDNLTHPRQVARKVVQSMNKKLNYYIIAIVNDAGEAWAFSVRIEGLKKFVRPIDKYGVIFNKTEIDMIFTGNKHVSEAILR